MKPQKLVFLSKTWKPVIAHQSVLLSPPKPFSRLKLDSAKTRFRSYGLDILRLSPGALSNAPKLIFWLKLKSAETFPLGFILKFDVFPPLRFLNLPTPFSGLEH